MTAERGAALPMSAYDRDLTVGTGTNAVEIALVRAVAKLKIEMVNELTRPITVNEMSFGAFMADRFYLFQDGNLDVPGDAEYSGRSYGSQENEAERLNIVIGGGGVAHARALYLSLPMRGRMSRKIRPTPSDSARPTLCIRWKAFIGGGASRNSIARNTQVRIRAVLHTDANLCAGFPGGGLGGAWRYYRSSVQLIVFCSENMPYSMPTLLKRFAPALLSAAVAAAAVSCTDDDLFRGRQPRHRARRRAGDRQSEFPHRGQPRGDPRRTECGERGSRVQPLCPDLRQRRKPS